MRLPNLLRSKWIPICALVLIPLVSIGCGDDGGTTGGGGGGGVGGGAGGGTGGGAGGGDGGMPITDGGQTPVDGGDTSACSVVAGSLCTFACDAVTSCAGTLVCPYGYTCDFTCSGDTACDNVTLDCATNSNASCSWACAGPMGTCTNVTCTGTGCATCSGNRCP